MQIWSSSFAFCSILLLTILTCGPYFPIFSQMLNEPVPHSWCLSSFTSTLEATIYTGRCILTIQSRCRHSRLFLDVLSRDREVGYWHHEGQFQSIIMADCVFFNSWTCRQNGGKMDFIIFELSNVIYLLNNNYSTIRAICHIKGCDWTHDECPSKTEGLFCPSNKADDLECVWQCGSGCFSNSFSCQNTCQWCFFIF